MREAERQVQHLALGLRAVADADQRQLALETLADARTMLLTSARVVPAIAWSPSLVTLRADPELCRRPVTSSTHGCMACFSSPFGP
jgi:hypothetical protein